MLLPVTVDESPVVAAHHFAHVWFEDQQWDQCVLVMLDNIAWGDLEARVESHLSRLYGPRIPGSERGGMGERFGTPPASTEFRRQLMEMR